jgi:mono/diheme cytochrome c family protein
MAKDNHKGGIGFYVFIALVLVVITYFEFAIVQYNISWISRAGAYTLLAVLSLTKFFLVIWFFMHLKDDNKTYTGFFSSGMVIAMGTFIALAGLFTVRSAMNVRAQQQTAEVAQQGQAGQSAEAMVEIPERAFADTLRVPQPKNQGLSVEVPKAATNTFTLNSVPAFGLVNETTPSNAPATPATTEPDSSTPTDSTSTNASTTTTESTTSATTGTSTTSQAATTGSTAQASTDWNVALGEKTYTNCVACHQPNGQGVPGAFPPQAGHAPDIYNIEGGRTYMIHVVLYGLQGAVKIKGNPYNGVMTAWGPLLKDDQIAAALNHVLTSWGNDALLKDFKPITPEEVAAERAKPPMTAQQVYESRAALNIAEE